MARTPRCAPACESNRLWIDVREDLDAPETECAFVAHLTMLQPRHSPDRWEIHATGRGRTVARAVGDAMRLADGLRHKVGDGGLYVAARNVRRRCDPCTLAQQSVQPPAPPATEPETVPLFGAWRPTE